MALATFFSAIGICYPLVTIEITYRRSVVEDLNDSVMLCNITSSMGSQFLCHLQALPFFFQFGCFDIKAHEIAQNLTPAFVALFMIGAKIVTEHYSMQST